MFLTPRKKIALYQIKVKQTVILNIYKKKQFKIIKKLIILNFKYFSNLKKLKLAKTQK